MTGRNDLRDDVVDRAWRDAMRDTPPPPLDDAIRAAARRAVDAKPSVGPVAQARSPWRWWMPLAAAATIGAVAIGVIQTAPQDAGEPTVLSDATSARKVAPAASPPAPPATSPASAGGDAPAQEVPAQRQRVDAVAPASRENTPAAPAPARNGSAPTASSKRAAAPATPAGAAAPEEHAAGESDMAREQDAAAGLGALGKRKEAAVAERDDARATGGFVPSPPASPPLAAAPPQRPPMDTAAQAPVPATAPGAVGSAQLAAGMGGAAARAKTEAPAARPSPAQPRAPAGASAGAEVQAMAVTPPDVYIASIRRLLVAGDRDGAVRELQRFRRTHADADARMPEDLRPFAASVPR